jgi:hypothetical protein
MGCKQTTIKSPSLVLEPSQTSPISSTTPIYVKSALKQSRVNGIGKPGRRPFSKRKPPTLSKSVNFDENVRVKLRTPTPKQSRYENTSSAKIGTRPTSNNDDNDDDDDDDQLSSVSSQEDINNETIKPSKLSSAQSLQRTQSNGFWHKTNSVAAIPSTNNIKETNQQPPVNMTAYPTENPNIPTGNRFRVRRKVQYSALPQTSNSVDPNQSSTPPFYRSTLQVSPLSVQRPLSGTNSVLIEHRGPFPSDGSSPQTAYYAFIRRPTDRTTSTEK